MSNDLPRLRDAFVAVIGLIALLTVPAGTLIGLTADPLVRVLLGERWLDAIELIQVFAVFGVVRSVHGPTGSIYLAVGKPKAIAALQLLQFAVAMGLMALAVPRLGVVGAAWSMLAAATTAMTVNYLMVLGQLELPMARLVGTLWRPVAATAAMAAVVAVVHVALPPATAFGSALLLLCAQLIAGIVTYAGVTALCWRISGRPDGAEQTIMTAIKMRLAR